MFRPQPERSLERIQHELALGNDWNEGSFARSRSSRRNSYTYICPRRQVNVSHPNVYSHIQLLPSINFKHMLLVPFNLQQTNVATRNVWVLAMRLCSFRNHRVSCKEDCVYGCRQKMCLRAFLYFLLLLGLSDTQYAFIIKLSFTYASAKSSPEVCHPLYSGALDFFNLRSHTPIISCVCTVMRALFSLIA